MHASVTSYEYVGFWLRVWATMIDFILAVVIIYPVLIATYGWSYLEPQSFVAGPVDFLVSWVLPAIAVILFWIYKLATPGKMAISAKIVDSTTGGRPSNAQLIGRYFAYFISALALGLGYVWIAFDSKKQAWHDKLAGTVVIRPQRERSLAADFQRTLQQPEQRFEV